MLICMATGASPPARSRGGWQRARVTPKRHGRRAAHAFIKEWRSTEGLKLCFVPSKKGGETLHRPSDIRSCRFQAVPHRSGGRRRIYFPRREGEGQSKSLSPCAGLAGIRSTGDVKSQKPHRFPRGSGNTTPESDLSLSAASSRAVRCPRPSFRRRRGTGAAGRTSFRPLRAARA